MIGNQTQEWGDAWHVRRRTPRGNVNAGVSELIAACIVAALGSAHSGYTKGVRNGVF